MSSFVRWEWKSFSCSKSDFKNGMVHVLCPLLGKMYSWRLNNTCKYTVPTLTGVPCKVYWLVKVYWLIQRLENWASAIWNTQIEVWSWISAQFSSFCWFPLSLIKGTARLYRNKIYWISVLVWIQAMTGIRVVYVWLGHCVEGSALLLKIKGW